MLVLFPCGGRADACEMQDTHTQVHSWEVEEEEEEEEGEYMGVMFE